MATKPVRGTRLNISHPLSRGLVLCQLFNERTGTKTFDLSLNQNHGTLTNGPTWSADSGILFDGNNDLINYGHDASLANIFDTGATISAWIYMNSYGANDTAYIINKHAPGANDWVFYVENAQNELNFLNDFDGGTGYWTARDDIATGSWFQVGVTYKGLSVANDPVLYVNGKPATIDAETAPIGNEGSDAAIDLVVGRRTLDLNRSFDGMTDNIMIYKRILTAGEMNWLYREPYAMFL